MKNRNLFVGQAIVSLSSGREFRVHTVNGRSVTYYDSGVRQVGDLANFKRKKFKKGDNVTFAASAGTWGSNAGNGKPCTVSGIYGCVDETDSKKLQGAVLVVLPMPKREECDTLQRYSEDVPFVHVKRVDEVPIFGSLRKVYIDKRLLKHI